MVAQNSGSLVKYAKLNNTYVLSCAVHCVWAVERKGNHKIAYHNQQVTGNVYGITRTMPLRITPLLKHDAASLGNRFPTFRRNTVSSKCWEQTTKRHVSHRWSPQPRPRKTFKIYHDVFAGDVACGCTNVCLWGLTKWVQFPENFEIMHQLLKGKGKGKVPLQA